MKVIKITFLLIVIFFNANCSSCKDQLPPTPDSIKNQSEKTRIKNAKKALRRNERIIRMQERNKRESTDELRDEQMQDYEITLREMY
ncbi:hypothetical protein [Flavobacterium collinsii]|uniref:Secreted protein n=1 Tax=Flavobacterium collinsii TaxID=1114861 RepID=A0ABM8KSJ7_9FLAO|nr:hypothetical protein [Flavobacterium collinsii]CAA9203368.1 hypothetical protein FLACOL7796_04710 [Flavobacterium collinsii]